MNHKSLISALAVGLLSSGAAAAHPRGDSTQGHAAHHDSGLEKAGCAGKAECSGKDSCGGKDGCGKKDDKKEKH